MPNDSRISYEMTYSQIKKFNKKQEPETFEDVIDSLALIAIMMFVVCAITYYMTGWM